MCVPLAVLAAGSLIVGAVGVGLQASGQAKAAGVAKDQANLNAATTARQAQLSLENADRAEAYGHMNADLITATAGINNKITTAVAGANTTINDALTATNNALIGATTSANISILNSTTDFNVAAISGTTDFNVASAEGAAQLLEAQGRLAADAHTANAAYADQQGDQAMEAGLIAERTSRGQYAQLKGQQRSTLAASGVALDEGSALRIQSDTDYMSDVDADTIRSNAIKTALGYRVNAINERFAADDAVLSSKAQAIGERAKGVAAKISGMVGITQAYASRNVGTAEYRIGETVDKAQNAISGVVKDANTALTASVQILQTTASAKIDARNALVQGDEDAWTYRAQAEGYTGASAQAKLTANGINPTMAGLTSLTAGVAGLGTTGFNMAQTGVFSRPGNGLKGLY